MISERMVLVNDTFIHWEQANIHMMSHSFSRGSAIFEVLSVHNTDMGPCIFKLDDHVKRLFHSASLLDMVPRLTENEIQAGVFATVKKNAILQGAVKIMGYNPEIAFDILPSTNNLDIAVFAIDPAQDLGKRMVPAVNGVNLCVSRWCKLDPRTVPVEAKAAANYLNGMLARKDAQKQGCDMAVMMDTQGFLAEGGTESIFLVMDGRLMTPVRGTILNSITRNCVITLAKNLGIPVVEDRLSTDLLEKADEIFFTCTPMKVLPVKMCEKRPLSPFPGPVTRQLADFMAEVTSGRSSQFSSWLFPVQ